MSPDPRSPETIFGEAIEIESPEDRAAYLDRACEDDPDFRREVEKLVIDHFRAGDFLEKPADINLLMEKIRAAKEKGDHAAEQKTEHIISDILKTKGW